MIQDVINEIFFQSIGRFWPWLRKRIYRKDKFVKDIEFDVRSSNPLTFILNSQIPHATLYLKIINKSQYLEITFDRALLEIWIRSDRGEQPVIYQGKMISRKRIEKKGTAELYWTTELNDYQTKFLKTIKDSRDLSATVTINYDINSDLYEINDQITLGNRQCKIEG
ncbi:MAG: hypothetical protein MPEBLZ_03227 [Candidatus Methanoperedens nitroreducens]|uniref:Uncharacterized protein n=1 Tax=Candidatus Methanoperedens nitratireducens TaxID=1392998 RepID=A0A0P8DX17_9EURY|nr:hypothetical protein [Candidatus Methanoperedens sp. BLZ2]KAB2945534.1 MAG: hypothetical protein F9K14_10930 [Candidatus Methanoperedens sp.]KPQ42221.1 MAG: hypothetical protein MPEBLZ_03227 [Candidatus Methanoperedens sp. BLZ1]MBZ0175466.1 hypothetical protein [Candidatus Methanoperedens nitroreducens]CAG1006078.1 hypothetical protein METP2_03721 [Methanosarcinales archaeon]MCX9078614.1 hypothetical protein [Candidatus Methanoperedens sp.]